MARRRCWIVRPISSGRPLLSPVHAVSCGRSGHPCCHGYRGSSSCPGCRCSTCQRCYHASCSSGAVGPTRTRTLRERGAATITYFIFVPLLLQRPIRDRRVLAHYGKAARPSGTTPLCEEGSARPPARNAPDAPVRGAVCNPNHQQDAGQGQSGPTQDREQFHFRFPFCFGSPNGKLVWKSTIVHCSRTGSSLLSVLNVRFGPNSFLFFPAKELVAKLRSRPLPYYWRFLPFQGISDATCWAKSKGLAICLLKSPQAA